MNWLVAAVTAWVFFGLELGLRDALRLGSGDIGPSFVVVLCAFIALHAPPKTAQWSALLLGVLADLTWQLERVGGGAAYTIGPTALGLWLGARLVLAARGSLRRGHPLTLAAMTLATAAVAQIVVTALLSARSVYGDELPWSPSQELFRRLLSAVYSGGLALVLWVPLRVLITPVIGFPADRVRPRHP